MSEKRLLVISYHSELISLLQSVAERQGYRVLSIRTLHELQEKYLYWKPHLIIFDVRTKGEDGVFFINYFRDLNCKEPMMMIGMQDEKLLLAIKHIADIKGLNIIGVLSEPVIASVFEKKLIEIQNPMPYSIEMRRIAEGIEHNFFVVHYQPKVNLKNKKICGLEALVRLKPPHEKLVFPQDLISISEETGMIVPLTHWVIRRVFEDYKQFNSFFKHIKIAINLSPKVLHDLAFPDEIQNFMDQFEVPGDRLCFEVTESGVSHQSEVILEVLTRLRLMGLALSIDDFGTGYSSIVELQRLPFTELKIDKQFVFSMLENESSYKIVRSIINLGQSLDLELVAEGVETIEVLEALKKLNCDIAQGFLISKALSIEELLIWIKQDLKNDLIWDIH